MKMAGLLCWQRLATCTFKGARLTGLACILREAVMCPCQPIPGNVNAVGMPVLIVPMCLLFLLIKTTMMMAPYVIPFWEGATHRWLCSQKCSSGQALLRPRFLLI